MRPALHLLAFLFLPLWLSPTGCSQDVTPPATAEYKQLRDQGDVKADAGARLELDTLSEIAQAADRASDPEAQRKEFQDLFDRSGASASLSWP